MLVDTQQHVYTISSRGTRQEGFETQVGNRIFRAPGKQRTAVLDKIWTRLTAELANLLKSLARPRGIEPLFSP